MKTNNRQYTICIDAGHGGNDCGALNIIKGCPNESDYNLMIAKKLDEILTKRGFKTVMTRKDRCFVTLSERACISNNNKSDLFVSIHHNSASCSSSTASGVEVCIYNTCNKDNYDLASRIASSLSSVFDIRNRGVKERRDLYVLKHTKAPALLIEILFMSCKRDMEIAICDNYAESAADAIADIITEKFSG